MRVPGSCSAGRTATLTAAFLASGLMAAACGGGSSVASGSTGPASAAVPEADLLSVADLPAGWTAATAPPSSGTPPCSAPPSTASLVGPEGRAVRFDQGADGATLVEYAVRTPAVVTAYGAAIRRLESPTSCSTSVAGQVETSRFDEVITLPRFADGSVGMLETDDTGGVLSQSGYVVVIDGRDLLVVGLGGHGNLDTAALQGFTGVALGRLGDQDGRTG